MLRLMGFLRPFVPVVIIAIILLFVQAICDLNLPNLMSDIVNVGIQQGGVEDATPRVVSKDGRAFAETFMSQNERDQLEGNYELKSGTDEDAGGKPLGDTWPKAALEDVYVLKSGISPGMLEQSDTAFGNATWTMVNLLQHVQQARDDGTLEDTLREEVEARALAAIVGQLEESGQPLPPNMSYEDMASRILEQQMQAAALGEGSSASGLAAAADSSAVAEAGGSPATAAAAPTGSPATAEAAPASSAAPAAADSLSSLLGMELPDSSELDEAAGGDAESTDLRQMDFSEVYKFQPLLELLPQSWYDEARAQALAMDPTMRAQSGTMLVAGFYRELGRDMGELETSYILRIGLMMLLVTAISGVATILVGLISSRTGAGIARDLRSAIFGKVSNFSHTEFDRFSTASLITRSTNDVTVMQMLVTMGIRMICYAPIMGIGGTVMALSKSTSMSWIIGLAVVVLMCIIGVLAAIVMPKFRIMQTLIDRLNLVARESLVGLMVIRAFSRSDFETQRFDTANKDLTKVNLFVNRAMVFMMPVMMLFMNGLSILIIWVGAHQVVDAQMQVGDMMAYMQYVMQIMMAFMFIAMIFVFVPRAQVSAKRIADVLETQPVIRDPKHPQKMDPEQAGRVEFRNVSFRFEGSRANALESVSFTALPGQTTAFIGSTGSGKSTIINLIPRFYDATKGSILVGGVDVRKLAQESLRSRIGYVPQQSVLMAGTVESNILFGVENRDAAGETKVHTDVEDVAATAQASEFINALEDGYDTAIAQGGTNVSGGQRQRLSIARALAVHPDIYLFDDSFSALDFTTDAALRRALAAKTAGATLIIVAQRVSTIMDADQIFVIDEGRVVGRGTHEELLESCEAYAEIASSQLTGGGIDG